MGCFVLGPNLCIVMVNGSRFVRFLVDGLSVLQMIYGRG